MIQLAVRAVGSALIIVAVTLLGGRFPRAAGFVTAMPLVTTISVAWLLADGCPAGDLATYLRGVLVGMAPTALLLGAVVVRLHAGATFGSSLLAGLVAWAIAVVVMLRTGVLS